MEHSGCAPCTTPFSAEKFPLLKRLSIASLISMLFTAFLLVFLYQQEQRAEFEKYFGKANDRILSHLAQKLGRQINDHLLNSSKNGRADMQAAANLDALLLSALNEIDDSDNLKLKIYDLKGRTVYSSAKSEIGGTSTYPELLAQALHGTPVHKLDHRNTFLGKKGEMHDVHVYATYRPLFNDGQQSGVIESYHDATPLIEQLNARAMEVGLLVFCAFLALYAVLFYTTFRTDRAVSKWRKTVAESEESLREAQSIAGVGSYVLDITTGNWQGSAMLDQMLGIDQNHERSMESWAALFHPDDRAKMLDHIRNDVINQGKSCNRDCRIIRHNDQAVRWVHGLGKLEFDACGRPVKLRGTLQDITERKQVENSLRIAAATFETHDAILITDANSNIVRVNRAFTEITGYTSEEILGKNPRIMQSGRQDRVFYSEMWKRLLHEGFWSGEIWDKRKNGEIYPKWLTITAVMDERHEPTHYVAIFSDITERKRIEEEIRNLAFYDVLTKLPNRRLFLERFRSALSASARRDDFGAVLFIDLDRFKALNDALGHDYGDLLLIEVGQRIKGCIREMDTVSRFGGDEFVVLLETVGYDKDEVTRNVAAVAEKIRAALALPYKLKDHEHHCSPSIGISLYHGNETPTDILLEYADMAMYQAKNSGRNTVKFFDPVMQHSVATHDLLENDLHHALASQQLQLHYQIQVNKDQQPIGAEAFLRWQHPEHGTIMPGQFLPIADESALIIDIGRWALETACQQLASWDRSQKTRELILTINISAKHFAQPDFVGDVSGALARHGADPTHLKLELSEKIMLADLNSSMDKVNMLRHLGVQLSMDNFATVYSSLSYLKYLSPDQLKIHRDFVQGIAAEGNDEQLVTNLVKLARSLDLSVFAEGKETEEQLAFLKRNDCDSYQGYLFGRPLPAQEFEDFIRKL